MLFRKVRDITGHAAGVYSCRFNENLIYTGSADKYIARWKLDEGVQDKFAIQFEQAVYSIDLIENRWLLAGLSDGALHVFDLHEKKEVYHYRQHTKAIFCIRHNQWKKQTYITDADGNLSIWDEHFKLLIYLPLDSGKIRDIAIEEGGKHFTMACQDGTLRVFEANFFNEIKTIQAHEGGATSVVYHPVNRGQLISGGKDALLKQWDLEEEKELKQLPAHNFAIYRIIVLNNSQTVVTASRDKTIKIWDSNLNFQERLDMKEGGHRHSVNDLAKIDEKSFLSVSDDKRIIVWELD